MGLTKTINSPPSGKAAAAIKHGVLFWQTNWQHIGSNLQWRVQNEKCNVIIECTTVVVWVFDNLRYRSLLELQWLSCGLSVPLSSPYLQLLLLMTARNKSLLQHGLA
jgi:hypothetical protein